MLAFWQTVPEHSKERRFRWCTDSFVVLPEAPSLKKDNEIFGLTSPQHAASQCTFAFSNISFLIIYPLLSQRITETCKLMLLMSFDSGLKIANKGSPQLVTCSCGCNQWRQLRIVEAFTKKINACWWCVTTYSARQYSVIIRKSWQVVNSKRVWVKKYVMVFFSGDQHFYRRKAEFRIAYNANIHFASLYGVRLSNF